MQRCCEKAIPSMIPWYLSGPSFGSCNCDYGCPCQFESKPTLGHCRGFEAAEILQGHFGDTKLDGLRFVILYAWPGPVYEGKGEMQAVIDERADAGQREALLDHPHRRRDGRGGDALVGVSRHVRDAFTSRSFGRSNFPSISTGAPARSPCRA